MTAMRERAEREARDFTVVGRAESPVLRRFVDGLARVFRERGYAQVEPYPGVHLVFNVIDAAAARPYHRHAQATYVVSIAEAPEPPADVLLAAYPLMIRSLSNLFLYVVPDGEEVRTYFITLERGYYPVRASFEEPERFYAELFERLEPLASSHLVINNVFDPDLPERLWNGDEHMDEMRRASRKLGALNLNPAPFPIEKLLPESDFRHVQRLYQIGGLSYGNLSVRRDENDFWMSASGVDKTNIRQVGRDALLVKGYVEEDDAIHLSVPPVVTPRRVSVDAIEHWMIYRENPKVGAVLHVHAWIPGIDATEINYPCGTLEIAQAVAEKVRTAPDPRHAIVGLKNHGMTITGESLDEIFERIEGKVVRQVPML